MTSTQFVYSLTSSSPEETQAFAQRLASQVLPGDILALEGNLASGKTTFTQGFTEYFQIEEYAASPTFTYMNEYHSRDLTILHIDAYRLKTGKELVEMGFWEYIESGVVALIEWADIVADILPADAIRIVMKGNPENPAFRLITIESPRKLDLN